MRRQIIALGLLGILIFTTIMLELTVMGNHEEMVELEYEAYQIRIDYQRMLEGVMRLFDENAFVGAAKKQEETPPEEESGAETGGQAGVVPTLKQAPTAPTLKEMPVIINGR